MHRPSGPVLFRIFPFAHRESLCLIPGMSTMTAIYENGVFRPLGIVRLPEHTRVEVELPDIPPEAPVEEERAGLLADVRALHGSLSLPAGADDGDLITAARIEKYGPL